MSDQRKPFDLVRGIADLARTDCFAAFNKDAGKGYSKQQVDVTDLVIQQHLNGICPIAVYPVLGDRAQFGTFDLDDKDSAAGWGGVVAVARRIVAALDAAGVRPVVVRSGSGQGIHIHFFLAEATPAQEVRRFMRQLLADAGHSEGNGGVISGQVEVYPKQDRVLKGKLGNAIALPFARQSLPLDSDFAPVQLDDWEVPILAELLNDFPDLPPPETKLTEWKSSDASAPLEGDLEKCRDALKHVPADSYDIWVKVGLALKRAFGEAARPQWIEWSQSAPSKFPGIEEAEAEWCGFDPDGRIGIGTIFHLAKSYGWSGPGDEQLRDMNARFGILTHGRSIQIILKNGDRRPDDEFEWLSREAFLARLKPEKVAISGPDGDEQRKEKARWWLDHPKASHYHRLDFDPARPPGHNGAIWNLWRGFAVQPMRGAWPRMREHIEEVIADGDERLALWLLNWLALGVQEAAKPIGTAPVLLGLPGTGKGFLANAYGALWNPHFAVVTHPEHVTGRFSGHLFAKRFLFIDLKVGEARAF